MQEHGAQEYAPRSQTSAADALITEHGLATVVELEPATASADPHASHCLHSAAAKLGRPLDGRRDLAILSAALELVSEVGYERVTMDAIAARAHAGKATIYRRWDSKAALIIDAIKALRGSCEALPDTGDVRADLLGWLRVLVAQMCDEDLAIMTGLLTASRADPVLASLLRDKMMAEKQEVARNWVRRGIARGTIRADVNVDVIYEIAPAVLVARLLITGDPVDEQFLTHLVDDVLLPLLAP